MPWYAWLMLILLVITLTILIVVIIVNRRRTPEEITRTITQVLRHEIAHHFGIGDQRLRELGAY